MHLSNVPSYILTKPFPPNVAEFDDADEMYPLWKEIRFVLSLHRLACLAYS